MGMFAIIPAAGNRTHSRKGGDSSREH